MKTFLAFGYDSYYPVGGQGDFIGDFATLTEALETPVRSEFLDVLDTGNGTWHSFMARASRWTFA